MNGYKFSIGISSMIVAALCSISFCTSEEPGFRDFQIEETTISSIHDAFRSGDLTARQLVEAYLKRIDFYDQPMNLNALVILNENALKRAEELDNEFRETGTLRPLHGIPVIVKDNYDTWDMQTTGGSLALKGSIPPDDSYQVRKLRDAGAIILAKSNMAEWAFSPFQTVSSIAGITRNPYDLDRVPAGSSGGTAASVSANFGVIGLGTDTGNSIRGPSSHSSLVGIRSTMGLTSRDGIVPLELHNDIGGPMGRTVEDVARIFEVIAGYDPADPITAMSIDKIPENYTQFLDPGGLDGAKIGVLRILTDTPTADPEIQKLFNNALEDMKSKGADIIDPLVIPNVEELWEDLWCESFQYDLDTYLASLGENAPYKTINAIFKSGLYSPYIGERLQRRLEKIRDISGPPPCLSVYDTPDNQKLRDAVLNIMDDHDLDAIVYPTWSNPPRRIGDLESPDGNNSDFFPPHTGQPAITVPMGYTGEGLPAGLQIVGKLFGEPDIIRIAYAYEQATRHRRPPVLFPELN
jgi:amidase